MSDVKHDWYVRGVICILLSAFCFACMNVCVRLAGDLPSVQKSFYRNLVAAVIAAAMVFRSRMPLRIPQKAYPALALRCLFGTLGILCNFYAIDHLLIADASILNKLSPFFAVAFSFLLLKETIRPFQAICVLTALGKNAAGTGQSVPAVRTARCTNGADTFRNRQADAYFPAIGKKGSGKHCIRCLELLFTAVRSRL